MDWLAWTIIYASIGSLFALQLAMMIRAMGWKRTLVTVVGVTVFLFVVGSVIWAFTVVLT